MLLLANGFFHRSKIVIKLSVVCYDRCRRQCFCVFYLISEIYFRVECPRLENFLLKKHEYCLTCVLNSLKLYTLLSTDLI